jgi:hypothetical protein
VVPMSDENVRFSKTISGARISERLALGHGLE